MTETVPALLAERAARTPDAVAYEELVDGRVDRVTFRGLGERAAALAGGLDGLGVGRGDRVAVMGQTTGAWACADLAILSAGAVSVGIYPTLTATQVAYILRDSAAKVAFAGSTLELEILRRAAPEAPALQAIIAPDELAGELVVGPGPIVRRFDSCTAASARPAAAIAPEDLATLIYTSGTTGVPKGAMLSHRSCVFMARTMHELLPADPRDRSVSFLPMAHVGEHVMNFYGRLYSGMATRYVGSMDGEAVLRAIAATRPTVFGSVPRIFDKSYAKIRAAIAEAGPLRRRAVEWAEAQGRARSRAELRGALRGALDRALDAVAHRVMAPIRARFGGEIRYFVSGSAPIDADLLEFFHAAGMLVLEGYGLTECAGFCTANRPGAVRFGTVGRAIPGVEVRVAEDGEILVRGPGNFLGYLNDPEATRAALDGDGWLHTGDIGELDHEGYLTITDRKKSLLVTSGGKKVAPAPIESLLTGDAVFGPAMVIGERRPYLTALLSLDLVGARAVVGRPDATAAELARDPRILARASAVVEDANRKLARFEQIRRHHVLDRELTIGEELTPTMKLRRGEVEARFATEIDGLYASGG